MTVTAAQPGVTFTSTHGPAHDPVSHTVGESCGSPAGRWYCITHDEGFANQLSKDSHISGAGDHSLVWVCFEHGPETP